MRKVRATIVKEWILLLRDPGGFLLLFLMPALLILVMALVQDAPFKDYQEQRFDLLLADNDGGSLAKEIRRGLQQSKVFHVVEAVNGRQLTDTQLKALLQKGKYSVGIVIPKGATAEVVNSANIIANTVSEKLGLGSLPARESRGNTYIRMYFDPVAKPTFRLAIANALDKFITYSCSNLLVSRLSKLGGAGSDTMRTGDFKKIFGGIGIREVPLDDSRAVTLNINSVQHNVPAWAIFGMFFILLPIVTHSIKEREEGSALRLQLVPGAYRYVATGKIAFYMLLCTAQFFCMFAIGRWILPWFGLPSLHTGVHAAALIPVAVCIAFAATAYGFFVSNIFRTANQGAIFGAVSVVLLSALSGIWVPIELLPPVMKSLALASPMHWGLEAVQTIILRNGGFNDILLPLGILLGSGIVMWLAAALSGSRQNQSF